MLPDQQVALPKPLLIAVHAHKDEALMSILMRASHENVLGRAPRLASLAGIETNRVEYLPFTKLDEAGRLAALLGMPDSDIRRRMHPDAMHPSADEYVDWYGTPLPRRYIETRQIRFSDTGGADYVRATWAIKPLDFCPETRSPLRSACNACGAEQRWTSVKQLGVCHECRASLVVSSPTVSNICLGAILASGLVSIDPEERAATVAGLPAPFNTWQAGDVFQAVVELGLISSSPIAPPGCTRLKAMGRGNFGGYDHRQLAAGFEFVQAWPESLHHHVKQVTHGRSGAIRVLLGRLGKYVDQQGAASPLRRAMDVELPNAIAAMDVPLKAYKVGGVVKERRKGIATVSEAALLFGVDKKVIGKLQKSPRCLVSRGVSRSSVILLDQAAIEHAMLEWRSGMTHARAAIAIGAPPYAVPALVDAGFLQSVNCLDAEMLADGANMVTTSSVESLRCAIIATACNAVDDPMACDLRDGMVRILHPATWVEVVRSLVQGKIAHTPPIGDKRFLHGIRVAPRDLEHFRLLDERRPLPDALVSGVVAADLLAVSNTLVSGAVAAGLINGSRQAGRIDIPLSEVRRYGAEFIGAEEVSRDTGLRSQDLAVAMRGAAFEPAGQMYNTYYWRRAEVRALLGSQIG